VEEHGASRADAEKSVSGDWIAPLAVAMWKRRSRRARK
jgi:hypothetical protein